MPAVDYAIICDHVRVEGALAHMIAGGIDTIFAPAVPTAQSVGVCVRLTFTRAECGRPHRLELIFQNADGGRLAHITATAVPGYPEGLPPGWPVGLVVGLNLGLPLPEYGVYSLELLVDDQSLKSMPMRVVPMVSAAGQPSE